MKKTRVFVMTCIVMGIVSTAVLAQQTSWGSALKAAGQAAVQQLCPQAQATVDQAKKLGVGASQENFLVTKAKEFLAAGNYQPALDLASYVITTLNSKSVDAKKIMADAKTALMKMAQDKLAQQQAASSGQAQVKTVQQIKTDASQTVTGIKGLFGSQK
ncbi:MAG: hypothetical protein HQL21_01985 [Candidatus Omnitrophica bacterium]|nr:hypothetical protein [Candidatus Omnitrophota bacterium]